MVMGESLSSPEQRAAPPLDILGSLLFRNTLLNFAGQGVPLLVALATIPFLIRHLGQDRFGVLSVDWVIINCSTIFDLGLGRAVRKLAAEALGKDERDKVAKIAWSAVTAQCVSGTVGALVLCAIASLLASRILHIPPELRGEARTTFYLLAATIPLVVITDSLWGLLEAAQRFDLVNAGRVPFYLSVALVPLIGVLLGWHLPGIAMLLLLSVVAILVLQYVLCLRVFPELRRWPSPSQAALRTLFRFGGWVMVSSAVAPILIYLDRLVIGVALSMGEVTLYTAPYEMVTHLSLLPASLAATLFPAFSTLGGQGRLGLLQVFAARSVKYLLLVLGPVIILTIAFSREILGLWLGPTFGSASALALRLLAVGVLVSALAQVPYSLIQGRGRPDLSAKFHLIELPIHAALVWVLIDAWGIPGAALSWSLRVMLDAGLLFAASARLSGLTFKTFLLGRVIQGGGVLAILGLVAVGVTALDLPSWGHFAAPILICLAAAIVIWSYVLDGEDRAHVSIIFGLRFTPDPEKNS